MRTVNRSVLCLHFVVSCCCLVSLQSAAAPYEGEQFNYTQPDGTEFKVRLYGDEYYAVAESLDGYVLTEDPVTRFFCYAKLAADGRSFISTGVPVAAAAPASLGLTPGIRLKPGVAMEKSMQLREILRVDTKGRPLADDALAGTAADIQPSPPDSQTVGERIGLVLLASFPDRQADVVLSREQVDAYCNDPDYTEFNNATSIFGYFFIQSNGKLRYNCIVTAYFTAANNRSYYTDATIDYGIRARELIREGLTALDATGFDFTKCDGNSDNMLDGVNIFYAGSTVNNWSKGLWPHKSSSSWNGLSAHGMSTLYQYQISSMGTSLRLGTFCHENGHMLCGFPDLYAYSLSDGTSNAANIGAYSLMASSGSTHPRHIDAYLKIHAGWADVVDIDNSSHFRGGLEVDKNTFYRYRNPAESREYFLLSIRNNTGYEGPYGGATGSVNPTRGLVIFHARENGSNPHSSIFTSDNPNCDYSTPYELMVVEASPSATQVPWYDNPTPGSNDGYYSGGVSSASDSTMPALKFWSGTGRTVDSGLNIHTVSDRGHTMTFIVGAGAVTGSPTIGLTSSTLAPACDLGTDAASQSFAVSNKGGGTLAYSISDNQGWISTTVTSGTATSESDLVTVNYNTDGLAVGSHTGTITVTAAGATNSPQTIAVSLTVFAAPNITVTPTTITELVGIGKSITSTIEVSNNGGGTLFYAIASNQAWLTASIANGTVSQETDSIALTLDATGLTAGNNYTGTITITDTNGHAANKTVTVNMCVTQPDLAYVPETFTEATANNGSISNSVVITLTGDTFAADVVSSGRVSANNVPTGLTASFVRDSNTQITMSLTGNAAQHADANDISNLQVVFVDAAFSEYPAANVTDSSKDLAVDFDEPARASVNDVTVFEGTTGTTTATFTVTLSQAAGFAITVNYETVDDTATTADNDYVSKSGSVMFDVGQTSKDVVVTINGDTNEEASETFKLSLTGITANAEISDNEGVCTINNGSPPRSSGGGGGCTTGQPDDVTWLALAVLSTILTLKRVRIGTEQSVS